MSSTGARGKLEGVGVFLCVSPFTVTWEEREGWVVKEDASESLPGSLSAGGMCSPASGCLRETRAGRIVSPDGQWVCVITWHHFRGSFTLKIGPIEPATSITGVSHTTGAYTYVHNVCGQVLLTSKHTVSPFSLLLSSLKAARITLLQTII